MDEEGLRVCHMASNHVRNAVREYNVDLSVVSDGAQGQSMLWARERTS